MFVQINFQICSPDNLKWPVPSPKKSAPLKGNGLRKAFWEFRPPFCLFPAQTRRVQYRKWSPTANDPQNGPQMILDRKWSLKSTANDPVKTWGMEWILWDWLQKRTDYKKESFFSRLLKKKGRRTLHLRSIYTRWKKNWINLKSMVLTVYFFLCRLLQFFFEECFVFWKI